MSVSLGQIDKSNNGYGKKYTHVNQGGGDHNRKKNIHNNTYYYYCYLCNHHDSDSNNNDNDVDRAMDTRKAQSSVHENYKDKAGTKWISYEREDGTPHQKYKHSEDADDTQKIRPPRQDADTEAGADQGTEGGEGTEKNSHVNMGKKKIVM